MLILIGTLSLSGTKTDKALSWSIAVVNHTWLEDCFAQWRNLTTTNSKYSVFPPGVDFSELLTNRNLHSINWDPAELDSLEALTEEDVQEEVVERDMDTHAILGVHPDSAAASFRDAKEVEEAVTMMDTEGDVSVGAIMDVDMVVRNGVSSKAKTNDNSDEDTTREAQKSVLKNSPRRRRKAVLSEDNESNDEVELVIGSKPSSKTTAKKDAPRSRGRRSNASEIDRDSNKDKGGGNRSRPPPSKGDASTERRRSVRGAAVAIDSDDEPSSSRKAIRPPAAKARPSVVATEVTDSDDKPITPKKSKRRSIRRESMEPNDDDDIPDDRRTEPALRRSTTRGPASTTSRKTASPGKVLQTPHRVSVVLPTVADVYSPKKALNRNESVSVSAAEAPARSPGKVHRPARDTSPEKPVASSSKKAATTKGQPARATSTTDSFEADSGRSAAVSSEAISIRTPSKRSAANKAMQKLHDEIMPDLINFQKEMKRNAVRSTWESDQRQSSAQKGKSKNHIDHDDEPEAASRAKNKKRMSVASARDSESENERPVMKKQRTQHTNDARTVRTNNGKRSAQRLEDEDEDDQTSDDDEQTISVPRGGTTSSKAKTE